ncbi:hypothetical protein VNO77_43367 [Canavalia gladiata]|uniref:Uncharacterized protein n=1 Tax=Canavalia gladiata TaxID=3824 RepID=A0AAN9JWM4_CANGL
MNSGLRDLLFQLAGFLNWKQRGRLFTHFEQDLFRSFLFHLSSWWVLTSRQGLIESCECFYRGKWIVSKLLAAKVG